MMLQKPDAISNLLSIVSSSQMKFLVEFIIAAIEYSSVCECEYVNTVPGESLLYGHTILM